jgi:hypothetical protein
VFPLPGYAFSVSVSVQACCQHGASVMLAASTPLAGSPALGAARIARSRRPDLAADFTPHARWAARPSITALSALPDLDSCRLLDSLADRLTDVELLSELPALAGLSCAELRPLIGCAPSDSLRGHFVMRFLDSLRAGAGKVRPVKMSGCDSTVFDPCHGVAIAAAVLRGPADSRGSCVLRIENRPGASVIVRKISFHRDRAPRQPKCHPPCGLIDRFGTNQGDFIATGARRLSHFLRDARMPFGPRKVGQKNFFCGLSSPHYLGIFETPWSIYRPVKSNA